jgi:hypothetical protein
MMNYFVVKLAYKFYVAYICGSMVIEKNSKKCTSCRPIPLRKTKFDVKCIDEVCYVTAVPPSGE